MYAFHTSKCHKLLYGKWITLHTLSGMNNNVTDAVTSATSTYIRSTYIRSTNISHKTQHMNQKKNKIKIKRTQDTVKLDIDTSEVTYAIRQWNFLLWHITSPILILYITDFTTKIYLKFSGLITPKHSTVKFISECFIWPNTNIANWIQTHSICQKNYTDTASYWWELSAYTHFLKDIHKLSSGSSTQFPKRLYLSPNHN